MHCDDFGTITLFVHVLYILIYDAFYFPPSMGYLVRRLDPTRRRKVNSLLNFKPLSFTQVKHCYQQLSNLLLAPLHFSWLDDFLIPLSVDDLDLIYDFHKYLI